MPQYKQRKRHIENYFPATLPVKKTPRSRRHEKSRKKQILTQRTLRMDNGTQIKTKI